MSYSTNSSLPVKMRQLVNAKIFMFSDGQNIFIGNRISRLNMPDGTITACVYGTCGEKKLNVDAIEILGTSQYKEDVYISDR